MKVDIKFSDTNGLTSFLLQALKMEAIKQAIKHHSGAVQGLAQRKAAVDTGFMKRSIMPPEITDNGLTATVRSVAEYSGYVEKGTRFMEAQPFLEPALEEVKPAYLDDLKRLGI